jgi:hypothetical protein
MTGLGDRPDPSSCRGSRDGSKRVFDPDAGDDLAVLEVLAEHAIAAGIRCAPNDQRIPQ